MTRKRHNNLKASANRRFAEAVGSALLETKIRLTLLCWAIEKIPASKEQTEVSIMASDLVRRINAMPNATAEARCQASPEAGCPAIDRSVCYNASCPEPKRNCIAAYFGCAGFETVVRVRPNKG